MLQINAAVADRHLNRSTDGARVHVSRYYFILQWGAGVHDDGNGTLLPDDEAAHAYAKRIIGELRGSGGYDDADLAMVVKNATGEIVFSFPFSPT